MGTRAAFWVGNPCENGELLGCIAFDGYPERVRWLDLAGDEAAFRECVKLHAAKKDDWTPSESGWPFPWEDDIFITDYNYAWFNGKVQTACFNSGWVTFEQCLDDAENEHEDTFEDCQDALPKTPARVRRSRQGEGRDSIMIITAGG
jgi:hypothetical protein